MLVRTEGSLDAFANDFLTYLCGGFHIGNRWRIKVITCNDKTWAITIPHRSETDSATTTKKRDIPSCSSTI